MGIGPVIDCIGVGGVRELVLLLVAGGYVSE